MLESLAAWVLKYYLGKYVENLNTDQLSIGLLQGQVELENLPLKKEALRQAGLPIQINGGFIGKIKLQIPIRQIRTAPWVILIEKLYLVAGPVNLEEWDEEAEAQALHEQKMSALDALEAQWRADLENQDQGYYASSYSSWLNFGTSIITNIVENLQLNITDVHFRYEDEICIPDQCFTFGLAIDSLVAQSCNDHWEPGFDSGPIGYKIIELSRFSIYWDDSSGSDLIGGKEGTEFMDCMGKMMYRGKHFVLNHVSGTAHIKKNRSAEPLRSRNTPRIICDVLFDEFPIIISDKQYAQVILWLKGIAVISTRIRNHRFRPQYSVMERPREWWHYAYKAVLHKIRPHRYSLETLVKRIKDNVDYVKIYSKLLNSASRTGILSPKEETVKNRVEYEQTFEELRVLREIAMYRTFPPPRTSQSPPKMVVGSKKNFLSTWFPQWWYSTGVLVESVPEITNQTTLDSEIMDAFAHSSDTTYLKRDVVFGLFNFSLKNGSLQLCAVTFENKKQLFKPLMELQFEKVLVEFEYRPRSGSYKTTLALGSIYLKDKLTKETVFPMLISPQSREDMSHCNTEQKRSLTQNISRLLSHAMSAPGAPKPPDETLFQLTYEYKPFNSSADYRILMKTQSLDVVYNPEAVNWLADFFSKPLHHTSDISLRAAARKKYQAIKTATKNELIKNWEKILAGDLSNRKTWEIDLDISAPQIIFVEHFCDKNAIIVVVDFGHLHFSNRFNNERTSLNKKESDDEEAFQTPCSTPPGSGVSPATSEPYGFKRSSLSELSLHHKLYDRYELELGDMQVFVGKVRDNWKYAHLKGTSTLHVLDRFNISLQVERRIVHTNDPQFPSLTFFGTLPRLVVHVNEHKISALRAMLAMITDQGLPSPFRNTESPPFNVENEEKILAPQDENLPDDHYNEMSKLIVMQFTVQHLALEVQSRNRSIAELQVSGVRAAATIRPFDTSVTLSVHSLLLVDALQTFGRDFELLVASHKHVVVDSLSGSIRDSEPTSPIPPGSPEPSDNPASPVAFSQILNTLQHRGLTSSSSQFMTIPPRVTSPPFQSFHMASSPVIRAISPVTLDLEALICVELTFVSGACPGHGGQPLQIAAIQFNNLDIIANQETIVELLGFARRVFPASKPGPARPSPIEKEVEMSKSESASRQSLYDDLSVSEQIPAKTEVTFDFHRLNVLLLRAVQKDGVLAGRKICTATMMQAKIKATVGEDLIVGGSLGGIQIVDLTPEGMKHQRILSLGADPLVNDTIADLSAGLYSTSRFNTDKTAFSFTVKRSLQPGMADGIDVTVRLASVWYTHSPLLVKELQSCATEFKQYLTNLARSIKSAATEMAMGFVHARAEALAQSLSMSGRLSASLYGGSTSDISSPKKRRRSFTQSVETLGNTPHTPYSPIDDDILDSIDIRLDVVLDTPVIILPVSPASDQVFVAHLGKITIPKNPLKKALETEKYMRCPMSKSFVRNRRPQSVNQKKLILGYSDSCNPNVVNEFAAAAFRIGHSLLRPHIPRMSSAYTPVDPPILLRNGFFNPDMIYQADMVDEIVRGLITTPVETLDQFITGEITNHLFEDRRIPFSGIDLAALNIQRGRDHAIRGYNEYRALCNLKRARTFEDLAREIPQEVIARLKTIYESVDDIDLFPGGMSERPVQGGIVGPTFACIIGIQFRQLRKCDRFWYETDNPVTKFTEQQLSEIRKITLSKVLCENMNHPEDIQRSAFDQPSNFLNPKVPCHTIPDIDLNAWRDSIQGCNVNGRKVALGSSAIPTPCTSCVCTAQGMQCASLRVNDCNQLLREWSKDAVLRDDVCTTQCGFLLNDATQFNGALTINNEPTFTTSGPSVYRPRPGRTRKLIPIDLIPPLPRPTRRNRLPVYTGFKYSPFFGG